MSIRELENIKPLDEEAMSEAEKRWLSVVKTLFSLGRLEETITQIAGIKGKSDFTLDKKALVIMCADNGVVSEGISQCGSEVTATVAKSFLEKKSTVCIMAERANVDILPIDAGMASDVNDIPKIKVSYGTKNIATGAAMSREECVTIIKRSIELVGKLKKDGYDLLLTGEMGIGNTSSSSLWMTCFTGIPLDQCVGAGSGLNHQGINHKYEVLKRSLEQYPGEHSAEEILCRFGGYEMVMAVGAMLKAAELGMVILIDGFIMTNCILAASRLYPEVMSYAIFGHQGDESGHKLLLDYLGARPLLNLGLRLGEGSGSVCAYPIVDSAVKMLNEMDSFAHASITKYF